MFSITIRMFPKERRGSFSSLQISIDKKEDVKVSDLLIQKPELKDYKLCRGTTFLVPSSTLVKDETINAIP